MPAIKKPNQHFNVVTYTATPGSGATVSGVGFQPDLLWTKNRNNVESHYWQDSVRGFSPSTGVTKMLVSNSAAAEANVTGITCTTTSDGFTVADSVPASGEFWFTDRTYVGWSWKAGGAAVTNTSGTLTSQVSANPTAGFSICTYTAPASSQVNTFGHGLGVAPSMVIAKNRSSGTGGLGWAVYHSSLGVNQPISLNSTAGTSTVAGYWGSGMTSSVVSLVTSASSDGYDNCTGNMVAYCFAPVAGYSSFGSYTGNGSTDGPFIYTGFKPKFMLLKRTDTTGNWFMLDSARNLYNVTNTRLTAEGSYADDTDPGYAMDFLSNGIKLRATNNVNISGASYIYMAFAEAPFKFSNGR
jgi:hypothetical protein